MTKTREGTDKPYVIREFAPKDAGHVIEGQLDLYRKEYGLDTEIWRRYLISAVQDFADHYDSQRDFMVVVEREGKVQGGACITPTDARTAQFRFFFLNEALRGTGLGRELFARVLVGCRERDYRHVFLWTFSTLEAARHLYRKVGFTITETKEHDDWGPMLTEERWDLDLSEVDSN